MAYTSKSSFIIEGRQDMNSNRAGTWKQEVMQRPRRGAVYWFAHHGLLSLLLIGPKTCLGMEPPMMGWALPRQSVIKKMVYSWILGGHFLNQGSLFSYKYFACQADIRAAITVWDHGQINEMVLRARAGHSISTNYIQKSLLQDTQSSVSCMILGPVDINCQTPVPKCLDFFQS